MILRRLAPIAAPLGLLLASSPAAAASFEVPDLRLGDRALKDVSFETNGAFQLDERYTQMPKPVRYAGALDLGELPDIEMSTAPEDPVPCGLFLDGQPLLSLLEDPPWGELPEPHVTANSHTDKQGKLVEYDQIGRRWDRPVDYEAYRYPVARYAGWGSVASGYDLDLPDEKQRRGKMKAVGHGGVDLPQEKGAPIHLLALSHQQGNAEVLFAGKLWGNTVLTRHTLREGKKQRHYVLVWAHLDEAAPGVVRGRVLREGELLGFVGDTDSPDFVHLHLEARRLREWIDPKKVQPWDLFAREVSVVTDPRNVLPLKKKPRALPSCQQRLVAEKLAPIFSSLRYSL
jgi:hypothetical protein